MALLIDRTELTQGALADIIPVLDVSDTTDSAEGTSKYATIANTFKTFFKLVPGFEGYIIIPASGNVDGSIVESGDVLIGKGAYYSGDAVIMVANQDNPTLDAHFDSYVKSGSIV